MLPILKTYNVIIPYCYKYIRLSCNTSYLFIIAMASNDNLSLSEEISSGTDLSGILTENEEIDTTNWMPAKRKKLQHMKEFHEEYQQVFGEKASIRTIIKNRILNMNPPMPESICREEMQSATQDNEVVIEFITDAQGKRIKKLTPILVKTEPDREYTQHFYSDSEAPKIPEEHFNQEREVTIASYSETISSESSSEDRTLTAETENTSSSMEDHIEDGTHITDNDTITNERICTKDDNVSKIESALHQIATSLQHATEGYISLAASISKVEPYELPKTIAQIPPPPINVPLFIRKALSFDGEEKVINHILRGEYELTNTSWSKLQNKYGLTKGRIYNALKGRRRPGGLQYRQKKRHARKLDTTTTCTNSETD